jgi:hypothetical protein
MNKKPSNPKHALGIRKVPIHAVPFSVMSEVGLAMMEGGMKYGTHNYREVGVRASTYVDGVWRHLFQQWWDQGEDIDADSFLNHVTKAIACLCVMRDSMLFGNFIDDRPIRQKDHVGDFNEAASKLVDKYPEPVDGFTQDRKNKEFSDALDKAVEAHVWQPPLFSRKKRLERPVLVTPMDADPESGLPVKSPEIERQEPESYRTRAVRAEREIKAGEGVVYGKGVKELSDEDLTKLGQALFDKSGGADFIILEKKGMARMTAEKMKQIELILGSADIHPLEVAMPGMHMIEKNLVRDDINLFLPHDEPTGKSATEAGMRIQEAEKMLDRVAEQFRCLFVPTRPGVDKIPTRDGYHPDCQGCPEQDNCKEVDSDKWCSDCKHYLQQKIGEDSSYDDYAVLYGWPSCSKDRVLLKLDPKVANCPFFERKDDEN